VGRWKSQAGGLAAAAALVVVARYDPTRFRFYPPCPVYATTGLFCPGCGSTRAMHNLLNGEVLLALSMNPLLVLAVPFMGLLLVWPALARHPRTPWIVGIVLVAYGIARNLPFAPFTWLAPG
jgi:hypothetical protein